MTEPTAGVTNVDQFGQPINPVTIFQRLRRSFPGRFYQDGKYLIYVDLCGVRLKVLTEGDFFRLLATLCPVEWSERYVSRDTFFRFAKALAPPMEYSDLLSQAVMLPSPN